MPAVRMACVTLWERAMPAILLVFDVSGESDGKVCPQGKKYLSEAVARAESLGGLGDDFPGWKIEAMNTGVFWSRPR